MSEQPKRIQRRRVKGWRMPPNTVYVGRGSKWGNPFVARPGEPIEAIIEAYENNLDPATMAAARRELRGKNLACWCKEGHPCHGNVLLRIANGTPL